MASQREIHEAVARCVSAVVYYVKDRKSLEATRMVEFEIDRLARWIAREGLTGNAEEEVRKPILEELADRYGRKDAQKLSIRFLRPLVRKTLTPGTAMAKAFA